MQKKKNNNNGFKTTALVLVLLILVLAPVIYFKLFDLSGNGKESKTETKSTSTTQVKQITKVSTADIVSVGDVLIHKPIFDSVYNSKTGTYDFNDISTYINSYISDADFAVANLETTLGGTSSGGYTGFPLFNTPDEIADALKNTGFDLLLNANNHTYDKRSDGMQRTIQVVEDKGLLITGTRKDTSQKRYLVQKVNGIKIGIVNYTFETAPTSQGNKTLNGNPLSMDAAPLVNSFNYDKLDSFYSEMESNIKAMKKEGSEAIVLYIHWGSEYQLTANSYQKEIGQKMCDLGVDAIIGGHPHVIEPVETFTSKVSGKKTICIYSLGNIVSNQRVARMDLKTGNTEDGVIFRTVFTKYSNGEVKLTKVEGIPTWVNLYSQNGKNVYRIVPLDKINDTSVQQAYGVSSPALNSYQRTMTLIGAGINEYNSSVAETGAATANAETTSKSAN